MVIDVFRRTGALLLVLALAQIGLAESLTLTPSADATLLEVNPGNSAGGAGFFLAGTTQIRTRNRALLQFDLSAIPAGSQITSVGLQFEVTRSPAGGFEASVFGLHQMRVSWGEGGAIPTDNAGGLGAPALPGDATWQHRFASSTPWSSPGGAAGIDFDPSFSAAVTIYDVDVYQVEGTPDLISDVQDWVDNPNSNFGWMLMTQSENVPFTARRFASREDENGAGPQLFIEYQPVPEPGTWALIAVGVALSLLAARRQRSR